ncbi:MAG: hypothetical protein J0J04_04930 [Microbacterium sp.]|uniref:hypothetical protein n=1 Tax=Microbacterium sp. TaxID=51671 RepID=UPI001AD41C12|nr:hypothetical protein [Microbacterium sp.]MBN9214152.1 hypothetical protein [Microbacterium sp.]
MGTSKRYAHVVAKQIDDQIIRVVARGAALQTLSAQELALDRYAVTIDPMPKPVKAWVRFDDVAVLVDAEACRWTNRAVGIRFRVGDQEHRCWVWSSAVDTHP